MILDNHSIDLFNKGIIVKTVMCDYSQLRRFIESKYIGWTKADIARDLGVNASTLGQFLNGKSKTSPTVLERVEARHPNWNSSYSSPRPSSVYRQYSQPSAKPKTSSNYSTPTKSTMIMPPVMSYPPSASSMSSTSSSSLGAPSSSGSLPYSNVSHTRPSPSSFGASSAYSSSSSLPKSTSSTSSSSSNSLGYRVAVSKPTLAFQSDDDDDESDNAILNTSTSQFVKQVLSLNPSKREAFINDFQEKLVRAYKDRSKAKKVMDEFLEECAIEESRVDYSKQKNSTSQTSTAAAPVAKVDDDKKNKASSSSLAPAVNHSKHISVEFTKSVKSWIINPKEYEIGNGISRSMKGSVYKITRIDSTNQLLAFKQYSFDSSSTAASNLKEFEREVEILKDLRHNNVVSFLGVSLDPEGRDAKGFHLGLGIIMEYCSNGSLREYVQRDRDSDVDTIINILLGAAQGIEYLHSRQPVPILHRDIKSDNIFLDSDLNPKIGDFEFAKVLTTITRSMPSSHDFVGTLCYNAPECYRGEEATSKSDVYSFGCVVLEMLTGERPWNGLGNDIGKIYAKIIVNNEQHDYSKVRGDTPKELIDLMKRCLDYDKNKRPTMKEVRMELEKMMKHAIKIELDKSSDEYKKLENLFFPGGSKEGSLNRNNYRIVKIERIRHLFAERRYDAELSNIKSILNHDSIHERLLFHGTRSTDPMAIVEHPDAFMKDYSSQGLYGRGLYFAELARYSHAGYRHEVPNRTQSQISSMTQYLIPRKIQNQLLVCSVICGKSLELGTSLNTQVVSQQSLNPQMISQRYLGAHYHSVHAGPHSSGGFGSGDDNSCMYVVYKDTQVAPRYLITYEPR